MTRTRMLMGSVARTLCSPLTFPLITGRDEDAPDNKLVALALHDRHIGWREAIPVPRRGGSHTKHFLASEVTRIMSFFGHKEAFLRCDPSSRLLPALTPPAKAVAP